MNSTSPNGLRPSPIRADNPTNLAQTTLAKVHLSKPALLPLRAPMDFVDGCLVGAFKEHFIDASMRRPAGGPDQRPAGVVDEHIDPVGVGSRPGYEVIDTHCLRDIQCAKVGGW